MATACQFTIKCIAGRISILVLYRAMLNKGAHCFKLAANIISILLIIKGSIHMQMNASPFLFSKFSTSPSNHGIM